VVLEDLAGYLPCGGVAYDELSLCDKRVLGEKWEKGLSRDEKRFMFERWYRGPNQRGMIVVRLPRGS